MNIDFTDEALVQAIKRVESRNIAGIRIALLGGGCSGFKYDFNYADGPKSDQDIELDFGKFKMWVCPMSEMYLDGIVIGWEVGHCAAWKAAIDIRPAELLTLAD